MTTLSASISVNDVTVRYNNGHTAIYDVTFALQGGTICALVLKHELPSYVPLSA